MLNDTLSNALSHILNCEKVGKSELVIRPTSKVIELVLNVMKEFSYIKDLEVLEKENGGKVKIVLSGNINKCGAIKPRFSVKKDNFEKFEKRFLPAKDFGILIVSTSKGIMTHHDAKKKKVGGRLLAFCY